MARLSRPLNTKAVRDADEEIYRRHKGDRRPNALYAEDGTRLPLDGEDPEQAELRNEWVALYKQSLPDRDKAAPDPPSPPANTPPTSEKKPTQPTQPCAKLNWIKVTLRREDEGARPAYWPPAPPIGYASEPYNGALTDRSVISTLDSDGSTRYDDIPCGSCEFHFPEFFKEIDAFFLKVLGP